jgi:hypothetical protein
MAAAVMAASPPPLLARATDLAVLDKHFTVRFRRLLRL